MRQELDKQLCAKYPEIFRDRHKPMTQTAMCWGFACGDGWYALIDTLCHAIMASVRTLRREVEDLRAQLARADSEDPTSDWERMYFTPERLAEKERQLAEAEAALPVASQVKEKFGGLRFYIDGGTERHHAYISFAEAMSYKICETCGTTTDVYQTTGWVHTTCVLCAEKNNLLHRLNISSDNTDND